MAVKSESYYGKSGAFKTSFDKRAVNVVGSYTSSTYDRSMKGNSRKGGRKGKANSTLV